jgi:long-chain acyl-CoA synthetase
MIMASTLLTELGTIDGKLPAIDDGTLRLSYADVQRSVASERRWLQSMGVRRCALLAENSARWVLSDLALLASEAVNVPLPPSFTPAQTGQVLAQAEIEWILTDQADGVTRDHPGFIYVATSHRTGLSLLRRGEGSHEPRAGTADISKVTYTCDSMGTLKGVSLRQRAIQSVTDSLVAATARLGVQTHLCVLPLATLLENIAGVYVPLTMGAKVIVRPCHTLGVSYTGLNVPLLMQAIDSIAPESMMLTPELLRALTRAVADGWRAPASLKFIAVGDGAPTELLQEARSAGLPASQVRIGDLDAALNVTIS